MVQFENLPTVREIFQTKIEPIVKTWSVGDFGTLMPLSFNYIKNCFIVKLATIITF
jgi:hypothetical protein